MIIKRYGEKSSKLSYEMQLPNLELSTLDRKKYNQYELAQSIESILEILMALDEEAVVRWIKEKYPNGIGLYSTKE